MPRQRLTRSQSRPVLVDFFSGCGGTSRGFADAGFDVRVAIDNDPDAAATFQVNFPRATVICRDVRQVSPDDLQALTRRSGLVAAPLVFSACAPCQPFSQQKRPSKKKDGRVDLLAELLRFVGALRPDVIFVENVPGLAKLDLGPFERFVRSLRARGYSVSFGAIESRDFGVPQVRARLVLLASLNGPIPIPQPTHGPKRSRRHLTVRDAIGHLPRLKAGATHARVPHHRAMNLSHKNLERIRATPQGGGRETWPKRLLLACHTGRKVFTDAYGRLSWNAAAPALTTRCISYSNGRYGHPTQDRALSVREAACLQTFPESFAFRGNLGSVARQIGNAVPVALARRFATVISHHLDQTQGRRRRR